MLELTPFQAVAKIRKLVDQPHLRLPHGADDVTWRIEDDLIILRYRVTKVASRKGGEVITPLYETMLTWVLTEGNWVQSEPLVVKPNKKGEFIASYTTPTPREQAERDNWARMCYRPGNRAAPMERGDI